MDCIYAALTDSATRDGRNRSGKMSPFVLLLTLPLLINGRPYTKVGFY